MKRRGPTPAPDRRDKQIIAAVTPETKKAVRTRANQLGITVSAFIRQAVAKALAE